jgi:hypothetical protein
MTFKVSCGVSEKRKIFLVHMGTKIHPLKLDLLTQRWAKPGSGRKEGCSSYQKGRKAHHLD